MRPARLSLCASAFFALLAHFPRRYSPTTRFADGALAISSFDRMIALTRMIRMNSFLHGFSFPCSDAKTPSKEGVSIK